MASVMTVTSNDTVMVLNQICYVNMSVQWSRANVKWPMSLFFIDNSVLYVVRNHISNY